MEEDEPQTLSSSPAPGPGSVPPAVAAPPIAPIPPPAPALLLRARAVAARADSDSDREGSAPRPSADDYEVSEESRLARERQEKAVQELLMKRRAYAMAVPTNDSAVRARLRRLGEPITLFGEREMERRDRLRSIMVRLDAEGQLERLLKAHEDEQAAASAAPAEEEGPQQYPFYTEGSQELLQARIDIARYSLARAKSRIERARRRRDDPDEDEDAEAEFVVNQAGGFALECSEIGDDRPLSGCSFSHDGTMLATSSWSGVTKIWSMPKVEKVATLKGHMERATDVAFSPVDNCLATASADRTAKLWNIDGSLIRSFDGHLDRLARIAFHPSGKYLGTASFDKTWRMWDINTGTELLLQEGHSRSVYGICFHPDGSLAASCGLDALARVWDLRTGRSILAFEGHVKPVLGLSFSPNGYRLATGSEDNTCRIWDLRKRKCAYTMPAHSHLISQVKFEPQEGYFLATASYDTKAMVWSAQDFKPVKTLAGHEAKVTSLDITGDGQQIATVSHDRTIKIWTSRFNEKDKAMDID
uniref:LOW QUALITY PROTEIN: U4/U6 small nuclear ribonucleoprotein PRP4-like protein n=1 Tax=Elaeis guineensis var. tenera TaxID=51953 RepID=A0A6I9RE77_ELAGV|nr:LOW QUALITY PROTEIN: U4/U6 small nuclear ribonucleoprotein PRP4-like protein [Elaeis guineensis]